MRFETMEERRLLAGDWASSTSVDQAPPLPVSGLVAEGEGAAEGEDARDLVAFARALTDAGTRLFSAAWCEECTQQAELFEDGRPFLPFIEVTNPNRTANQIAITENIRQIPTWEFPDGTRLVGNQTLETIAERSGVTIPTSSLPFLAALPAARVGIGSPLHIPIDAYDPNGGPLTIEVTSSAPSVVSAEVLTGNRSLLLSTEGYGDMVFELFEQRAPVPAGRVAELAEAGFYEGVIFHRVFNSFVIQGGDPTGTGTGGSTLGDFDDQFHLELQHNTRGILSYAKSNDDTNDSQFFITEGATRHLDFNHSVFGILIEGEQQREAISSTATNINNRPLFDVVIETASIFDDQENGTLMLKALEPGSATITVAVIDAEGNRTEQTFDVTSANDTSNGAPFLNPVADDLHTCVDLETTVQLSSQDKEGDRVIYSVAPVGDVTFGLSVDSNSGLVTVTPPRGFAGELQFLATVRQATPTTTSSPDDNQLITIIVGVSPLQNPLDHFDVNGDKVLSSIDALLVINSINTGNTSVHDFPDTSAFIDVNGDCFVTPLDALMVINAVNQAGINGEGELGLAEAAADQIAYVDIVFGQANWASSSNHRPAFQLEVDELRRRARLRSN